ncbi:MAG: hypothetical protein OEM39_06450 [Acidimicrobiia bacterium]|nr:hypothetical protein [Acidimicrobiia bacterium]
MSIEPGSTLAHYRVVEKIGEGGMGAVWEAVYATETARNAPLEDPTMPLCWPATDGSDWRYSTRFERLPGSRARIPG